jgi:mannose-1-phosphate guanylyltransferase/mannose-6-phosphate isomerase
VVTGDPFRFTVTEQLAEVSLAAAATLIEPEARNTAPAVLAAALWLAKREPDALMIVSPADHVIPDAAGFRSAIAAARPAAETGGMVTFGIRPDRPETGYGYLELAKGSDAGTQSVQRLERFVEKPDSGGAQQMVSSGRFLWNAGIFLFQAKTIIAAFGTHAPEMLSSVIEALQKASTDLGFTRLSPQAWSGLPGVSIDYAIMEKERGLWVMPYHGAWSDLGSWQAVWQETGPGADGNVVSPHATAIGCGNTLLRSEHEGLELVGIGLQDIVAIATQDAVLVARMADAQRVSEAVAALKAKGLRQATGFARDHRPWGWFESLALGSRFQVKRIVVKPGAALPLQSHPHRAEHWIVVEGTARVTIGERVQVLSENQSVYIPLGEKHRLENPGKQPMVLIEVQTGSYLGEDDIIR